MVGYPSPKIFRYPLQRVEGSRTDSTEKDDSVKTKSGHAKGGESSDECVCFQFTEAAI